MNTKFLVLGAFVLALVTVPQAFADDAPAVGELLEGHAPVKLIPNFGEYTQIQFPRLPGSALSAEGLTQSSAPFAKYVPASLRREFFRRYFERRSSVITALSLCFESGRLYGDRVDCGSGINRRILTDALEDAKAFDRKSVAITNPKGALPLFDRHFVGDSRTGVGNEHFSSPLLAALGIKYISCMTDVADACSIVVNERVEQALTARKSSLELQKISSSLAASGYLPKHLEEADASVRLKEGKIEGKIEGKGSEQSGTKAGTILLVREAK